MLPGKLLTTLILFDHALFGHVLGSWSPRLS
jgi:hypothetical protein